MDASKLNALLTANGGWTKVVYISLNNGKQLLVTEDMKTEPDAIKIEGEFIRIKNDRYFANGMNDFLPRQVIEFHAIEFVECVYFAQNDESLLKPTSYAEFTTDRNFDIADTIEDKTHQASIRVSHPNVSVVSGGSLTKEYEITMSGTVTRIKLSGRNEQLKMDEAITNMYALPFDRDALVIERAQSETEALFDIKAYRKGTHEILVRIGSQELYFNVVVGDDVTLTVKKQAAATMLMAEEPTVMTTKAKTEEIEETVTESVVTENEESTESVMMMSLEEEVSEVVEEPVIEEELTESAEEPVVNDQVETVEEKQETVIVLGFSTKTLANGKTYQMEVLVEPEQSLTFTSSNESVATVSETGLITVVADSGQSTIKVIAADGTTNSVVIKAKAAQ